PDARDHVMRVLRVDGEHGSPLGLVSFFALHGTCLHGDSRRLHPDHKGLTASLLEQRLSAASPDLPPFVAICAQEAAGDVTPNHVFDAVRNIDAGHLADRKYVEWVATQQA